MDNFYIDDARSIKSLNDNQNYFIIKLPFNFVY